jgi:hypothetical protein
MDAKVKAPSVPHEAASAGTQPQPAERPSHEEIQERAYYIYLERGGTQAGDLDDWLQAERELNGNHGKS